MLSVIARPTTLPLAGLLPAGVQEWEVVIGHTRKVFVEPGDRIRPGTRLARASDSGAPDGCHLHFEKRALKGGLSTAVKPRRMLQLKPKAKD